MDDLQERYRFHRNELCVQVLLHLEFEFHGGILLVLPNLHQLHLQFLLQKYLDLF